MQTEGGDCTDTSVMGRYVVLKRDDGRSLHMNIQEIEASGEVAAAQLGECRGAEHGRVFSGPWLTPGCVLGCTTDVKLGGM